jgi:hypothetical protein
MGLYYAGNIVEMLLGVAFGGRERIAFLDGDGLADFRLGGFTESVEIEDVDAGRFWALGEEGSAEAQK